MYNLVLKLDEGGINTVELDAFRRKKKVHKEKKMRTMYYSIIIYRLDR